MTNSTFSTPASRGVGARELEHLVGHVEPDRLAGRPDAPGGDQDVRAGAGPEIEHDLARRAGPRPRSGLRSRATLGRPCRAPLPGRPRHTARIRTRRSDRPGCCHRSPGLSRMWTPPPGPAETRHWRPTSPPRHISGAPSRGCPRPTRRRRPSTPARRRPRSRSRLRLSRRSRRLSRRARSRSAGRGGCTARGVQLSHADSSLSASGITK